ncbi:MAG: hypothetical protein Q9211_000448 [Gyalolechia sp. 1 TL-2023]
MGAISDFVAAFSQDYDKYRTIEKKLRALCEEALQDIEFLWQSRVKTKESLEKKLKDRTSKYNNDESANVADIKDLVAGRIILARWLDFEHVEKILNQIFDVRETTRHPMDERNAVNVNSRFRGYDGLHFHVTLRPPSDQQSLNPVIEIQVMSAFMWGFMTLEHDIEYKRLHGEPNEDLRKSLESLKGLANLAEINLQMIDKQFARIAKLSFSHGDVNSELRRAIRDIATDIGLDETDKQCLSDLRLTDPRLDKARIEASIGQPLKGSCSWVLEDPSFVAWWTGDDSRSLWIHGGPAVGKTVMMTALIAEVSRRLNDRPVPDVLAYFFCQNTNNNLNTTVSVLRGLIYHLVDQEKKLIRHVRKSYDKAKGRLFEDEDALYALRDIFLDILNDPSLGNIYLMVDALDMCDSKIHDLLEWIIRNDSGLSPKIKWLFTSRDEPAFLGWLQRGHQLHISRNAHNVASFIDYEINGLATLKSYTSELRAVLRKSLHEKSDGTFVWVALVCKELRKVQPQKAVPLLEQLPSGVEPLYEWMLDRVLHQENEDDIELCRQILRLVILAFRPLHLEEIAVFAKIQESELEDLVNKCGAFITIREDVVYLIHLSAKDYLEDDKRKVILCPGQEDEHANIAGRCLEVMLNTLKPDICSFRTPGICLSDVDESRIGAHIPFHAQYACLYWIDHLMQATPVSQKSLLWHAGCQVYEFFQRHFLHWLEAVAFTTKGVFAAKVAIDSLSSTRSRMSTDLFSFLTDAGRFIDDFRYVIHTAPLQVYSSALVFSSASSIVKRLLFSNEMPEWIERPPILENDGTPSLQALEHNSDAVGAIVVSPDGQLLASAYDNNTVRLWDRATGASRGTLEGHLDSVMAVIFSPDGQVLASASHDNTIKLWDLSTGVLRSTLEGHSDSVIAVIFSPDGQLLASASEDNTIRLWNPSTGALQSTLESHKDLVRAIVFSPDGQLLASASDGNTVKLWEAGVMETTVFSHDSQREPLGSNNRTMRVRIPPSDNSVGVKDETGGDEDCDSFSDLSEASSAQSLPSLVSDSSSASTQDKYLSRAPEHLAELLLEDPGLTSMYEAAVARFGQERFSNNHDQLLKAFFQDLRSEVENPIQLAMVRGLRDRDARRKIILLVQKANEPLNPNKRQAMSILRYQKANRKQQLDDFLRGRASTIQFDSIPRLGNDSGHRNVSPFEQDDELLDEGASSNGSDDSNNGPLAQGDKEPYSHLEPLERFITKGDAFARFKMRFGYLLRPPTDLSEALKSHDLRIVQRFLTRNFMSVATSDYAWLQELDEAGYSTREIAELLLQDISDSPWIYFTSRRHKRHLIQTVFHIPGCAHQASSNIETHPLLLVEELCGIGGVVPSSRDLSMWYGRVNFEEQSSVSAVTYAADSTITQQSQQSRHDLAARISNVLANFCTAAATTQSAELCCDSFTVLLRKEDHLELRRVDFRHALTMASNIKLVLQEKDTELAVQQCSQAAEDILQELRIPIPEETPNIDLHYCALAAQFLCSAFLSYIQAHVGLINPFFLDKPQRKMILLGNQHLPGDFAITAELVELTCLADMTQEPVFAFSSGKTNRELRSEGETSRYDVITSAEDILDTWGPGYFIYNKANPHMIHAIVISGGFLSLVDDETSRFHWTRGKLPKSASLAAFNFYAVMRIGTAVSINTTCCIDEAVYRKSSFCALEPLGTHECFWEPQERLAGIQVGQYVSGNFSHTWKKVLGATLKERALEQLDGRLIYFLEQSWGLQVSFCTSVARRVSLRELVTDLLPIFVNPLKQDTWQTLVNNHDIIEAFTQRGDLFKWLRNLSHDLQVYVLDLVGDILKRLQHTGVDRRNTTLVIAWPQEGDIERGLRVPCRAETYWAQIIADAEDCATFAYVTSRCLETEHVKCRGILRAWQNISKMLVTEVSPSGPEGLPVVTTNLAQWELEDKKTYYVKKLDSLLRVKVEKPGLANNDVTHLVMVTSKIPPKLWKRLLLKEEERKNSRIRERQAKGDRAELVVIRAG